MALGQVLLVALVAQSAMAEELKVGMVTNTANAVDVRGKHAIDLWAAWANSDTNTGGYTVAVTHHDYTNDAALQAQMLEYSSSSDVAKKMDVIIPPYTSGKSKTSILAVDSGSTQPILVWGGASDSIFTDCTTKNAKCFGGFTVASKYLDPALDGVLAAAGASANLSVAMIVNDNGFSRSVAAGGRTKIAATTRLWLKHDVALTAYTTSLGAADITAIAGVIAGAPDVVVICGHPGDVEDIVIKLRSDSTYMPKAVIAINAFSSVQTYIDLNKEHLLENVIMPTQWAEDSTITDTIVQWTTPTFKAAMEGLSPAQVPSYHAAAAASLAIMVSHAMAAGTAGTRVGNLATLMDGLPATDTFYGKMDWQNTGAVVDTGANSKPMYAQQRQGTSYPIVGPSGNALATGTLVYPMGSPNNGNVASGATRVEAMSLVTIVAAMLCIA